MLRVAFVIRNDGLTKSGGDIDLARQYSALIAEPGKIETTVVRFKELDVADCDLVVLFNIDMPYENYLVARKCAGRGIPYVIYTLHPKASHVEEFLRFGTSGAQYLASAVAGFSLLRYETIACVVRLLKMRRFDALPGYRFAGPSARYVLKNASLVLVSCPGEADYIRRDFAIDARFSVVRHLVDEKGLAGASGSGARSDYILCAGRIEPRKNQMTVVEVAKACPELKFMFVGKKNMNHAGYVAGFEAAVAECGNIEWRDQVPLTELQGMIGKARAYINLSWFEVFSLIDMMALMSNTPSVLSTGSYLYDQIESAADVAGVAFVDARDVAGAARSLAALPLQASVPRAAVMDESWTVPAIHTKWAEVLHMVDGRN